MHTDEDDEAASIMVGRTQRLSQALHGITGIISSILLTESLGWAALKPSHELPLRLTQAHNQPHLTPPNRKQFAQANPSNPALPPPPVPNPQPTPGVSAPGQQPLVPNPQVIIKENSPQPGGQPPPPGAQLPAPGSQVPGGQPATVPGTQPPAVPGTGQPAITIDGQPAQPGTVNPTAPTSGEPTTKIWINGKPAEFRDGNPVPPTLPRAIAPPVGDQSTSSLDVMPNRIDLGTTERISRLVLRDTSARDILTLLVRAAGLNFAYTGDQSGGILPPGQGFPQAGGGAQVFEGPKISIDIENETIQSAFNSILQLSNLEANRVGNTVLVGPRLPNSAKSLVARSIRLNQVTAGVALNFLVSMGAEGAISRERNVTTVSAVPLATGEGGFGGGGGGQQQPGVATETRTTTESRVETQRIAFQDSQLLLRGLQVFGDERTNSLTLVGNAKAVQVAMNQLTAIDSRRRQVIVNVRILDVNLSSLNELSSSFSFGISDTFVASDRGATVINFGTSTPANVNSDTSGVGTFPTGTPRQGVDDFSNRFLAQLRTTVQNGNSKILTDPTITVQEGQTAQVNLTQEVFGGFRLQQSSVGAGGASVLSSQEPIIKQAGLIVNIKVDRIDDNGFVSLSVAPSVSSIGDTVNATVDGVNQQIRLLNQRSLSSGQIRLRDGQTLILSGIIQDSDRATVQKVPILGDIPLLGALFRRTNKQGTRQEVIVLLTPQIVSDSDQATWGYGYTPSPNAKEEIQRDRVLNPYRQRQQSAPQQQQTPGQQQPPGSRIQQQIPAQPQSPAPSQR